jgi:hypothetical protein
MRNIPIPVDTNRLSFVCVAASRPRPVNQDTGEVKVDKQGQTVFQVGLSAAEIDSDPPRRPPRTSSSRRSRPRSPACYQRRSKKPPSMIGRGPLSREPPVGIEPTTYSLRVRLAMSTAVQI